MLQQVKTLIAIEILLIAGLFFYHWAIARDERNRVVSLKAVTLTLLTPVIGLFGGNALVFFAYLVFILAFTSRTRTELAATYVLMLPMMPFLRQDSAAGDIYLFPLSAVFAMNVGALIGFFLTTGRRTFVRPGLDLAVLALIALFTFIDGRDVSATSVLRSAITFSLQYGVPYLVVSRGISRRSDIDLILTRLVMAGTLCSIVSAFQMLRHWVLYQSFYDYLHVATPMGSATMAMRGGLLRTGGTLVDYTAAGLFLASTILTLPYLRRRFAPARFWAVVAVVLLGLFATQLRGAWVGAAVGFVYLLAFRGSWAKAAGLAIAGVAAQLVLFVVAQNSSRLAEVVGAGGASAGTADYRRDLLRRGIEQIIQHPLVGQTPKQLTNNLSDLQQGQHIVDFVNSHLYVAMVAGLIGAVIWAAVWLAVVIPGWRHRGLTTASVNPAEIPGVIVVCSMVALATTSLIDRNVSWSLIAMGLSGACYGYVRSEKRRSALVDEAGRPAPADSKAGSPARRRAPVVASRNPCTSLTAASSS